MTALRFLGLLLFLAACTNNTRPEQLPQFRIAAVEVEVAPGVSRA